MGNVRKRVSWGMWVIQGAAVAAALGLVALRMRVSPGELSAVHGGERILQDMNGCAQCHGTGPGSALGSSCASCHGDIQAQLADRKGFHGLMEPGLAADCGRCHLEHKGADFPPVNRRSFALAGVVDPSRYAHEGLAFFLTGRHEAMECTRCHGSAEKKILAKGEKRFLGLDPTCTRCHADVHEGTFGPDCQGCHGQQAPFAEVAGFGHTQAFPLSGGHAGLACGACHAAGTVDAVAALLAPAPPGAAPAEVRACSACHRSPHREEVLDRLGAPFGLAGTRTCAACHSADHRTFRGPAATITKRQHEAAGFPLDAPHERLSCSACHAKDGDYATRYPGRRPGDCKACHGDPHRGEFEIGAFKGRDCRSCHSASAFLPADFDAAAHDAVFRLEGRHRTLACGKCHEPSPSKGPRDFRGVPSDCRSCHRDPHQKQFDTPRHKNGDCRSCHTQDSWAPSTFGVDPHAATAFPLTGAHLGTACSRCHAPAPAGAVRAFAGTSSRCSSCHADVHRGTFDGPGRPAVVAGRTDCARCHGTESFRTVPDFNHQVWTGYALEGAHAKASCAQCHGRAPAAAPGGRTLGIAAGRSCRSCHTDPHAGQFGPTRTVDCAKCHREEGSFRNLRFDHQKDSRFPLDELHSKAACAACHKPERLPGGGTAVRFKPMGVTCKDCHEPRGTK